VIVFIVKYILSFSPLLMGVAAASTEKVADIQFFGDVFLPQHILPTSPSSPQPPELFHDSANVLALARHNVANFEGVATDAFIPYDTKRFRLRMPLIVASVLKDAGIDVVTLANNHSLDFGFQGLFDTMRAMAQAGVDFAGAGVNRDGAEQPLYIPAGAHTLCLLAFSRTLPTSFWATDSRSGTAFADQERLRTRVKTCAAAGFYTIVAVHWGQESLDHPLPYQRLLGHVAIDAGARLVIGHHPHVLQSMEVYKGRPIFFSLGNFAFGSSPMGTE